MALLMACGMLLTPAVCCIWFLLNVDRGRERMVKVEMMLALIQLARKRHR